MMASEELNAQPESTALSGASKDIAKRLMTTSEVATLFHRTPRSLLNWERAGLLDPVRVGRSKFYRSSDIERLAGGDATSISEVGGHTDEAGGEPDGGAG